jgi:hypothetical protein
LQQSQISDGFCQVRLREARLSQPSLDSSDKRSFRLQNFSAIPKIMLDLLPA